MKLRLFSDPHLGVNRIAHTTMESRRRMSDRAQQQFLRGAGTDLDVAICGGDLFDSGKVPNSTLIDAFHFASRMALVLGGNHDLSNSSKDITAFDLLSNFTDATLSNSVGEGRYETFDLDGSSLVAVPHHSSQTLFDETLDNIHGLNMQFGILLLHCTYEFNLETSETALNLTKEQAEKLLERFDYIFIGHEHMPTTYLGGRVIMMGSTMPFSMGEIGDRYAYNYDTDTHEVTREQIWSAEQSYRELRYPQDKDAEIPASVEFIDLTGNCPSDEGPELTAYIASVWAKCPNLLMLRNKVVVGAMEGEQVGSKEAVLTNLAAAIDAELRGSELEPLWQQYRAED